MENGRHADTCTLLTPGLNVFQHASRRRSWHIERCVAVHHRPGSWRMP